MTVLGFPKSNSRSAAGAPQNAAPSDALEREHALDISRSWSVEAPAGSGKTGLLIQRFLKLLATVSEPEGVLALTFTNKATSEMRYRVLEALTSAEAMAQQHTGDFERQTVLAAQSVLKQDALLGWKLRENPHRLNIRTIDSLCGEIARAVPVLAGGMGQATPLNDASALYREAARAVFLQLGGSDPVKINALRTVLLLRDGNLQDCEQLLAQMLERREQWGKLVPLAAADLDDKTLDTDVLSSLNRTLQSILCASLSELQQEFPPHLLSEGAEIANLRAVEPGYKDGPNPLLGCSRLRNAPGIRVADLEHWKMLAHLLVKKDGGWRKRLYKNDLLVDAPRHVVQRLQDLLSCLEDREVLRELLCSLNELPPATYPQDQWLVAKALFRLLHYALIELKLIFAERNVCDFTELSMAARAALAEPDGRNHVTHALGLRLQHLLVDEMQDTSSSQYELLEDLTRDWQAPSQTVFLVGDPKQSIYLFRQARVERFIQSMRSQRLGDVPLGLLRLTSNFRSGSCLVGEFNTTFQPVFRNATDGVTYTQAEAARSGSEDGALHWHVHALTNTGEAAVMAHERKRARREEAETIAKLASDWYNRPLPAGRQQPWKIAVLVRSKHHAVVILKKLKEAGLPYRALEMQHLKERPEVLDAFALTRALLHPADRVAWLAVLHAPWCGVGLADLHLLAGGDLSQYASQPLRVHLRERAQFLSEDSRTRVLRTLDVLDAAVLTRGRASITLNVEHVWRSLGAPLYSSSEETTNVYRYLDLLQEEEQNAGAVTAARLAGRLGKLFAEVDASPDAIDVLTIHKAKGLEWDLVLLPALERKGKRDNLPLLDWLEVESCGLDGQVEAGVMLAPVPARGDDAGSLNRYVQKARQRQEAAELKRLLYVAATRARTSLQLFATAAETKTGELPRLANTLVPVVWEQANQQFQKAKRTSNVLPMDEAFAFPEEGQVLSLAASAEDMPSLQHVAMLERLPLGTITNLPAPGIVSSHALAGALGTPAFSRPQGSFAARAIGSGVHIFLDHLARWIEAHPTHSAIEVLLKELAGWDQRIRTIVRGLGMPASEIDHATSSVKRALHNTITSDKGRWLLQAHIGAVSEAKLTKRTDAQYATYRMDRSFFAGNTPGAEGSNVLWIVEYKTDEQGALSKEDFLKEEQHRYEPQLRTYAALRFETLPVGTPVMLALFHPMVPSLHYWPYQP